MNRSLRSRRCRCCVCLILVLVLLISWSPIRVQASALPEVAEVVTKVIPFAKVVEPAALGVGGTVFCWVALGLGVAFKAKQAVDAYNAYQDFTGDLETSIYYYPDGTWSYGVDVGFVDRVREFLFHKGYVVDASQMVTTVPEGVSFGSYTPRVPCVAYQYSYHAVVSSQYWVYSVAYLISTIPNDPYVTSATSACTTSITVNGNEHYFKTVADGVRKYTEAEFSVFLSQSSVYHHLGQMNTVEGALHNVFPIYGWTGIRGSDNVAIDYVAPLAVPMIEAYPEWHTNSRPATNPDTDEEITVLPIPLNPSADPETQIGSLTQPNIWQGSIADPMPDSDANPDTGTDTDPEGGISGDVTLPPMGDFQVDLTSFFPFCIPFDLYEFIRILCAEPEAPVFHWEVQDLAGNVYEVDVDLSPWNSHAQLFRDAQCVLFIIGLLSLTRKFIKW